MLCLITGGSGCGKSTYAEKLACSLDGDRYYIATMQVYDEESVKRVERHRTQRAGRGFTTIECEKDLDSASVPFGSTVLVEDLVNLTANEMFDSGNADRIIPAIKRMSEKCRNLIIVTNDVFTDGVSYPESTDEYLKKLAEVNAGAADIADSVIEVVYSIPVSVKGVLPSVV